MSDITFDFYSVLMTNAERLAWTPNPGAAPGPPGQFLLPIVVESDTGDAFYWDNTGTPQFRAWPGGGSAITALTGDVTASGPGSAAATIASNAVTTGKINNAAVTLAKIANAVASSKLLGSGASGSGSAYTEITLGTGLSFTGTTLNGSAGSGTVTNTGTLTSGQLVFGNGTVDITVGNLSGDVSTSGSGVTTIGALKVSTGMIQANAVTLAKLATQADQTVLGNNSGGAAVPSALTVAQLRTLLGLTATLSAPQGRLTLVSGSPVMASDQTAKSSVYYTPYVGDTIPIYDGTNWGQKVFAELTMALDTSNQLLNNVYDLFVWNNAGTIAIGAGPAWSNAATITVTIATPAVVSWTGHGLAEGAPVVFTTTGALPTGMTAGTTYFVGRSPGANSFNISTSLVNAAAGTFVATSGTQSGTHTGANHTTSRGTGAGTTELQQINGVLTNKNSITLTNGAGAGTSGIAANTATYVGSLFCTANGQTGMAFKPAAASGGSNNILALSNGYNRVPVNALSQETAGYGYNSTTWRAANASVGNRITFLDGLQQSAILAINSGVIYNVSSATYAGNMGTSLDSTSNAPVISGQSGINTTAFLASSITVQESFLPQLGMHYLQRMEVSGGGNSGFDGAGTSPTRQNNAFFIQLSM